jgi:hypothetical protein
MSYVRRRRWRGKEEHEFEPREQGKNLQVAIVQTKRRGALFQNLRKDRNNHTAGMLSKDTKYRYLRHWRKTVRPA